MIIDIKGIQSLSFSFRKQMKFLSKEKLQNEKSVSYWRILKRQKLNTMQGPGLDLERTLWENEKIQMRSVA